MLVRVVAVDDLEMHRSMLKGTLQTLSNNDPSYKFEIVGEFENGQQLIDNRAYVDCDLITLDIRMPEMDGLTTLLHLRRKCACKTPICMVSSEQEANIDRFVTETVSDQVKNMPHETKLQHMSKVEERVLSGVKEAGKINDLLNGCEKLMVDPRKYAGHIGANGFLTKPYSIDNVEEVVLPVINGKCLI